MGWIKGNFDGSTKWNPRKDGCGGVLRNHYSIVVYAIAIPIGKSTSHKVEARDTLFTIRMAMEYGF